MHEIRGAARSVRQLLDSAKYTIDYYQREYRWEEKQIRELIDDLTSKFQEDHDEQHERRMVEGYGHYFLGSIIISKRDTLNFIIDGQQRLTSLTLLLIFLRNAQSDRTDAVNIDNLIFSMRFGRRSFNIDIEERTPCMEALFMQRPFDSNEHSDSVRTILARSADIEALFPSDLLGSALPYFIDWLLENVHLVEITAFSDDDAYTIFETMNDRGLSLNPVEMLKGYLLANIPDVARKNAANALWKRRIAEFGDYGKEVDADCIKAWMRSQHAITIRDRRKGAKPEDFDRIGTEFHRWIKEHHEALGLTSSDGFVTFIEDEFKFYSARYLGLMRAATTFTDTFEHVFFNAQLGFTSQYQVLLAPLLPGESEEIVTRKIRIAAIYLDIWLNRRLWNFHSISYSTVQYAIFSLTKEIRGLTVVDLATTLHQKLIDERETFLSNNRYALHQQNRFHVLHLLARMTDYIERRSGMPSHYQEYVAASRNGRYEVEHIWANKPERHDEEFASAEDFAEYRNRIGGLLLLPKSFNASYGANDYDTKLPHYLSQNLLARSLHPQCYEHNPGFQHFIQESGLPFKPCTAFHKAELDDRQALYQQIAEQVWNPRQLLDAIQS